MAGKRGWLPLHKEGAQENENVAGGGVRVRIVCSCDCRSAKHWTPGREEGLVPDT